MLGNAQGDDASNGTGYGSEFGLDLKYSITPSLTLDATYNTDFAQVEVDEVVVNLDRFSVFLRAPGMARSALTGAVPVHMVVAG